MSVLLEQLESVNRSINSVTFSEVSLRGQFLKSIRLGQFLGVFVC